MIELVQTLDDRRDLRMSVNPENYARMLWHHPACPHVGLHLPIVQRAVVETLDDWPVRGLWHGVCIRPLTSQTPDA